MLKWIKLHHKIHIYDNKIMIHNLLVAGILRSESQLDTDTIITILFYNPIALNTSDHVEYLGMAVRRLIDSI